MPKRLLERFKPDSILEFQAAAQQRSLDAITLHAAGRRTAAIYLWGYVAEMTLKAAYFRAFGFSPTRVVKTTDLRAGLDSLGRPGASPSLHHLGFWAEALVMLRASTPGLGYADPAFGSTVTARAQSLYEIWRETIRYRKNTAYRHEAARARTDAEWLLIHSTVL